LFEGSPAGQRVPIGSVGVLRFERARMSEDTAQGLESEGGTRAGSYFFSDADLH